MMVALFIRLALGGWGFLKSLPWQVYAVLGAIAAVLLLWHVHTNREKAAYNVAFNTGFKAAVAQIDAAQAKADTAARAHVKTTIAKQGKISTETTDALHHDIASIDARAADILMHHKAAVAGRGAGKAGDPGATGQTAAGTCPAPAQDGLAWDAAYPLMVQAAKNDAQLNRILDWEEEQDALDALEPTEVQP